MSEQRTNGTVPSRTSPRASAPVRPLFSWAQQEDLDKRIAEAESRIFKARIALRRAAHGKKRQAQKKLQATIHECLKLEFQKRKLLRKLNDDSH